MREKGGKGPNALYLVIKKYQRKTQEMTRRKNNYRNLERESLKKKGMPSITLLKGPVQ